MKAIVLHQYGGPEELKFEEVPDPQVGPGEVLVRLVATSVNPVDYKLRSGALQAHMPLTLPTILGCDVAGIVERVGEGVDAYSPGDRVLAFGSRTYAELVVVAAKDLAMAPAGLDLVQAGALPLVMLTGEQLISRGAKVGKGQRILIAGAVGGVGRSAVLAARKSGASVIAGVRQKQVAEAESLGVDELVALDDDSSMGKLPDLDAVADAVGQKTGELLLGKVRPGGIFASVVGPPRNAGMYPKVRIEAVRAQPDSRMLAILAEDVLAGRLTIPVDRVIPLAEAGKGQAAAEKGGIGKVLLRA